MSLALRLRRRFEQPPSFVAGRLGAVRRHLDENGLDYPLWLPITSHLSTVLIATIAVFQRDALSATVLAAWVLPNVTFAWEFVAGKIAPAWLTVAFALGSVLLFLSVPVEDDFAPMLLVPAVGAATAMTPVAHGVAIAAATALGLGAGYLVWDDDGALLYLAGIGLGWYVGFSVRWFLGMVHAERARAELASANAAADERQRIAREIHDVVGHSLAVTMLHVTGARRALEQDADVEEAAAGLREAEQIGRQAMVDIRRTVGLLAAGDQPETTAQPGLADLPELVESLRAAGQPVAVDLTGDPSALSPAMQLQLYRVAQESLANTAKHAPGAPVMLVLDVSRERAHLAVRNALPDGVAAFDGRPNGGSGLRGMRQRVEQLGGRLSFGPDDAGWGLTADIPLEQPAARCAWKARK